jgi:hypothetical protein
MVEPTYFLACLLFQDSSFARRLKGIPKGDQEMGLGYLWSVELAIKYDALIISGDVCDVLRWPEAKIISPGVWWAEATEAFAATLAKV